MVTLARYLREVTALQRTAVQVTGSSTLVKQLVTRTGEPAALDSPPTVTLSTANASTSIANSTLYGPTSAVFKILGTATTAFFTGYLGPKVPTGKTDGNTPNCIPWWVGFVHEGSAFEILTRANSGTAYRIWVNQQPATSTEQTLGTTDNSIRRLLVDFGSRARRHIRLEFPGSKTGYPTLFGGVQIGPTDSLMPPVATAPVRLFVLGDSIGVGYAATSLAQSWFPRMGRLLGFDDTWSLGASSTGFLAPSANGSKYRDRVGADLYPYVRTGDIVLVQGSTNDVPYRGAVQAEATTLLTQLARDLRGVALLATGQLYLGTFGANNTTVDAEVKAAAAAAGVPFIDTRSPVVWSAGTGRVGATTGDGSADYYLESLTNGVHPSDAGHVYLGDRMAQAVATALTLAVG